jgi:hypothetical protein
LLPTPGSKQNACTQHGCYNDTNEHAHKAARDRAPTSAHGLRPGGGVLDPGVRGAREPAVLARVGVVVPPQAACHLRDRGRAAAGRLRHPVRTHGVPPRQVPVRPRARGDRGRAGAAGEQRGGARQEHHHRRGRPERGGEEHERAEEDQRGQRARERDARQDDERGQGHSQRQEAQELGGAADVERLGGAPNERVLRVLRRRRCVAAPGGGAG